MCSFFKSEALSRGPMLHTVAIMASAMPPASMLYSMPRGRAGVLMMRNARELKLIGEKRP